MNLKKEITNKFKEKDLHPLLVKFIDTNQHFKAKVKTIRDNKSKKSSKGVNKWIHPDLVGVYYPFEDFKNIFDFQKSLSVSLIKIFSFELKIFIDFTNVRESYFQAVSNSLWAHEGYLVAVEINEDIDFIDELRRLNNSLGIGIIKLNVKNIEESEILIPAKEKILLDWDTINKISDKNDDFKEFLYNIKEDIDVKKIKSKYDKVFNDEEMAKHLKDNNIYIP